MIITHRYEARVEETVPGTFLEIETRGLRPGRHPVTVIAIGETRGDTLHITQWIAGAEKDEPALLALALPVLSDKKLTVFHGPFLVPFLSARAEKAGLSFAPGKVDDIRGRFLALKPFFPLDGASRTAIAEKLGLPLPLEPDGGDMARLARRMYKAYDPHLAQRLAEHNLLHMRALYGMAVFARRWQHFLTRENTFFPAPVRLLSLSVTGDFLTAQFSTRNAPPAYYSGETVELTTQKDRVHLRIETKKGMITETMPCVFTEIFEFTQLADRTGFRVPPGVLLLQVEDKYLPDNLFSLLDAVLTNLGHRCPGFTEVGHKNKKK